MKKSSTRVLVILMLIIVCAFAWSCGPEPTVADGDTSVDLEITITSSTQVVDGSEQDNYLVTFNYTALEWQALSQDEKIEYANQGYNKAREQIIADNSNSFNVMGKTKADGDQVSVVIFDLNHENYTIVVYDGTVTDGRPGLIKEVEIQYP